MVEALKWCLIQGEDAAASHALSALVTRIGGDKEMASPTEFVKKLCYYGIELLRKGTAVSESSLPSSFGRVCSVCVCLEPKSPSFISFLVFF